MTDFEHLRYETDGRILTMTLNPPDAGNSVNDRLAHELGEAWTSFRDDPALDVAILTGAGEKAFCLGADMFQMAGYFAGRTGDEPAGERPVQNLDGLSARQHNITKPIVCAVNGRAAGLGIGLVADGDIVIASVNAAFTDPHVSWGGISAGGLVRLVGRLPISAIQRLAYLGKGEWLTAQRAYELGFVSEVMEPAELMPRARALAEKILTANQAALRVQKEAVEKALQTFLNPAMDAAREPHMRFNAETRYANMVEGSTAFTEHRAPDFEHPQS